MKGVKKTVVRTNARSVKTALLRDGGSGQCDGRRRGQGEEPHAADSIGAIRAIRATSSSGMKGLTR